MAEHRILTRPRPALAGVFGGGGLFGIGYALGIIDSLRERELDLAGSPMLGTSAGSWAASATALGISHDEFASRPVPRFPDPRSGILARHAREIFGESTHPGVDVVVTTIPRLQRTTLSGRNIPLADLCAASSAVPGLLAPHRINGVRYVDGGVRSAVSADLASPADLLVVVAPLAGAMFGPFGGAIHRRLGRELESWRRTGGGRWIVFSPDDELADLARRPDQLFDRDIALRAYDVARGEGAARSLDGAGDRSPAARDN